MPQHELFALCLGVVAVLHWLGWRVYADRLTYDTVQIMACIFGVGAVILWFLPTT